MQVNVVNQQDALDIRSALVVDIVKAVLEAASCYTDEVSIYFVDTPRICDLHEEFFDDPSTTDCITFPVDPDPDPIYSYLGEVFICPETAIDYCTKNGGDKYEETTLYIIHGLLHLLGLDDIKEEDAQVMRKAEAKNMNLLKEKGIVLKPKES